MTRASVRSCPDQARRRRWRADRGPSAHTKAAGRPAAPARIVSVGYPLGESTRASGFIRFHSEIPGNAWVFSVLMVRDGTRRSRFEGGGFHTLPHPATGMKSCLGHVITPPPLVPPQSVMGGGYPISCSAPNPDRTAGGGECRRLPESLSGGQLVIAGAAASQVPICRLPCWPGWRLLRCARSSCPSPLSFCRSRPTPPAPRFKRHGTSPAGSSARRTTTQD